MSISVLFKFEPRIPPPPLGWLFPRRDAALEALILRKDDRLLDDAGLSRCQAMGLSRYMWSELRRGRS